MLDLSSRPTASLKTRRFIWGVMLICVTNYLAHLFPISLIIRLEWLTETARAEHSDISLSRFAQVAAWFEFFLVSVILLFLAELLAFFVVLREGYRLCIGGWDGLTMNGTEYLLVLTGPIIAAVIPLMLLIGGAEVFVGTRFALAGIHTIMFATGFMTTLATAYNVGFALEPEAFRDATKM
ncbi:hypothetical protein [Sulfitobacter sp. AS59]|uniref:hypothetical protein n=1 Tax=Sulfitobacter sp. AS59 TaxID=3135784 RepID=UPI00316EEE45